MKLQKLIEICSPLHVTNDMYEGELTSPTIDSREVTEGSVFIALRGTQVDGHMFIEDAISRGAKVIICEESYYSEKPDVCIIEVEDSSKVAGKIAQAFAGNPANELTIIGITGTNGKTTTATLVYEVLRYCEKKASLLGTVRKRILDEVLDSRLTTSDPIELANDMKKMVEAGSDFLVMEVSSHALHQQRVSGFDFNVAAFTNLSHDHLDYHENLEAYGNSKKLLFDHLPEASKAVINMDDPFGKEIIKDCKAEIIPLSFENGAAKILKNNFEGISVEVDTIRVDSPLIGTFNAFNVGTAFLICKALGLNAAQIAEAMKRATGAAGRMERVSIDGENLPLVIVDYAHTPDALKNILSTLHSIKKEGQKLTVVFGAGGDRDVAKRPKMARYAAEFADRIIVTSDNPRTENPDLIIADILEGFDDELEGIRSITNRKEAIAKAIEEAAANDLVLIAGKGHETYQEVNGVRHPFDDREIAKEVLIAKSGGGN